MSVAMNRVKFENDCPCGRELPWHLFETRFIDQHTCECGAIYAPEPSTAYFPKMNEEA